MIEAAFKVREVPMLQRLTDVIVKKARRLFKNSYQKTLTGTFTELYKMVEYAAGITIYVAEADERTDNQTEKLTELRDITQYVKHQHIHSSMFTASVTHLVE